ncbi:hypothetical protein [Novosphingobium terrae]|uniref:hypothetical protein n=1 Tax=Novosphingobium terrae TaxID=2726189 RepID=UPI00197D796B|nr:hypothetical protein [Novosphingobium terrae]
MSYLSPDRQDVQAGFGRAVIWASIAGAATTVACFVGWFAFLDGTVITDPDVTLGYRIGMGVNMVAGAVGFLIPAAALCALGLAIFGIPLSHRLENRLMARWSAFLGIFSGGVAGGLLWTIISFVFSGWSFEGPAIFMVGAIFGAPTGFWWWFFYRRVLIRRATLEN